jgi:DNA-binding NarL/FixJ family response regulator
MKILIVDDHALFRDGLRHVLNGLANDITILQASNFEQALNFVTTNTDLDLVLLDLHMPGKDGFSALDTFARQYPAMPVVIISASSQHSDIQRALDAGAMGYIPKESTSSVMLNALNLILSGGIYVPPNMLHAEKTHPADGENNAHGLTPRQLEVLALLVKGCSNKDVASQMQLAEATVKMHVTAILKTLGVNNRTQAAMAVEKLGIALPQ